MPKPKAVIVDMDGTLYRPRRVRCYVAARMLGFAVRKPLAAWKTLQVLRVYRRAQEQLRRTAQPGSAHRQTEYTASQSGYPADFVRQCVQEWMELIPLAAVAKSRFAGVEGFCRWARDHDIPLAVLSDYDPRRKLEVLGLDHYFSVVVCAQDAEVGVFKPHPRGLQLALGRLGVKPEEALYVGDRAGVDDAVARAAGVPSFILSAANGWPQLLRRIQAEAA